MTEGLRVRHPVTSAVLLDTGTGMTRVLGVVTTVANTAGSINVPGFASGSPFALAYAQGLPPSGLSQTYPTRSISGTTLSWSAAPMASQLVYGAYAGGTAGKFGSGMPGFRALNSNLATQIDSVYANHCLLTTGAVNIPANGTQQVTVSATAPVVAYRGAGVVAVLGMTRNSNGTWTLRLGAGATAAAGTYYIFDAVGAASQRYTTDIGFRIRNPSTNVITYESRMKYMRVVAVRPNAADGDYPAFPTTTALGRDNLAAIADSGLWYDHQVVQGEDPSGVPVYNDVYTPYFVGAGVNGSTLTEGSVIAGQSVPNTPPASTQQGTTILVDVADF